MIIISKVLLEGVFPLVSNEIFCKPSICVYLSRRPLLVFRPKAPDLMPARPKADPTCTRCPWAKGPLTPNVLKFYRFQSKGIQDDDMMMNW